MQSCLISNVPILTNPLFYVEGFIGPSSVPGHYRLFNKDQSKVLAILPNGAQAWNDPSHDGGYEAAQLVGYIEGQAGVLRAVYQYTELTTYPAVFEVIAR